MVVLTATLAEQLRWLFKQPILDGQFAIELTNSNDGRGFHWARTNKRRRRMGFTLLEQKRTPFAFPVAIVVTRVLGKGQKFWDADSVGRGSAKEFLDSLVAIGWFVDDSHRWIRLCVFTQDDSARDQGPGVRIQVFRAGPDEPIPKGKPAKLRRSPKPATVRLGKAK